MAKETLTIKETAELLEVSPDTIRRRIKDNKIKAEKVDGKYGKQWEIKRSDIIENEGVTDIIVTKHEMKPQEITEYIKEGILLAQQQQSQEMKELKEQIQQLNKKIDTLTNKKGIFVKVKDLFNKEG